MDIDQATHSDGIGYHPADALGLTCSLHNEHTLTMLRFHVPLFMLLIASGLVACGPSDAEIAALEATATTDSFAMAAAEELDHTVDTAMSTIAWAGTMVGVYTHTGTVDLVQGSFTTQGGWLTGGTFIADLRTMVPTDEHYSATVNTKESLVEHLSSAEFFDVAAHPTASLTITAATGNTATVDLTIRGTTRAETLTEVVMTTDADGVVHATAKLVFDRQDYGVAWAPDMKDAVLEDDIVLSIILVARPDQ